MNLLYSATMKKSWHCCIVGKSNFIVNVVIQDGDCENPLSYHVVRGPSTSWKSPKNVEMVISILTVWECDENTFQSSKSIFLGTRGYSLKFERSENFKEAPSCPEKCFYKTEKWFSSNYTVHIEWCFFLFYGDSKIPLPQECHAYI